MMHSNNHSVVDRMAKAAHTQWAARLLPDSAAPNKPEAWDRLYETERDQWRQIAAQMVAVMNTAGLVAICGGCGRPVGSVGCGCPFEVAAVVTQRMEEAG
jgi:hypothetical protein